MVTLTYFNENTIHDVVKKSLFRITETASSFTVCVVVVSG